MENPQQIGAALDAICDRVEKLERWVEEGKVNGRRCAEERDRLQDAVRNLRDVKGRHHTQIATERLFALLPENAASVAVGRERQSAGENGSTPT